MKTGGYRSKTPNDWLAEVMQDGKPESVPPGWLTLQQMARGSGVPYKTVKNRVDGLIDKGTLQRKQFRIDTGGAGIRPVWHYSPVCSKKS